MARHNREGRGSDQRGEDYLIGYQPDWLRHVKVTRTLESGRQSTKTLFRNPTRPEEKPGSKVRTRIASKAQGLEFELTVDDPRRVVRRITIEVQVPGASDESGTVVLSVGNFLSRRRD